MTTGDEKKPTAYKQTYWGPTELFLRLDAAEDEKLAKQRRDGARLEQLREVAADISKEYGILVTVDHTTPFYDGTLLYLVSVSGGGPFYALPYENAEPHLHGVRHGLAALSNRGH